MAEAILPGGDGWIDKVKAAREDVIGKIEDPATRNGETFRQETMGRLGHLKKSYVQTYLRMHTRARLGVNDDKRKAQLIKDERLQVLKNLSTIELMHREQLIDYQNRLAGLQGCFALTEQELDASPVCPHCGYRPAIESTQTPASTMLDSFDNELDTLVESWTQTLLSNLADPTTKGAINLLKPDERKLVEDF